MDFVKNLAGGNKDSQTTSSSGEQKSSGGFMDKINNVAGGGAAGEKKEDGLDKGNAKHLVPFHTYLHFCISNLGSLTVLLLPRRRLGPGERLGSGRPEQRERFGAGQR